jgi:hypothetical protein
MLAVAVAQILNVQGNEKRHIIIIIIIIITAMALALAKWIRLRIIMICRQVALVK